MTELLKVPWDYELPKGDGTDVPNLPSEEGAALGAQMARAADMVEEAQRKRGLTMLPRCDDCAFRAGTLPNRCLSTLVDATKCVLEAKPFYCHKGVADGGKPKRLCAGAAVLMSELHKRPDLRERLVRRLRDRTKAGRKRRRQAARSRGAR